MALLSLYFHRRRLDDRKFERSPFYGIVDPTRTLGIGRRPLRWHDPRLAAHLLPLEAFTPPSTFTMPTPESEMFLAKKPKVPPTFEGVDFNDYAAVTDARDAIIREQWVKQMMARLVREELGRWNPFSRTEMGLLRLCGPNHRQWKTIKGWN